VCVHACVFGVKCSRGGTCILLAYVLTPLQRCISQVKVEIPVRGHANSSEPSKPGSKKGPGSSGGSSTRRVAGRGRHQEMPSSSTISEQVALALKMDAPVSGTKEWAKSLTSHQLGCLSQKQLKQLNNGRYVCVCVCVYVCVCVCVGVYGCVCVCVCVCVCACE